MDYITLIGTEYPDISVHAISDPTIYENIVWDDPGQVISKEVLDAKKLELIKNIRITYLSEKCQEQIMAGFTSTALGTDRIYDSEEVDQINLIGAVSTTAPTPTEVNGYTIYYACRDVTTNLKNYEPHTHYQLRQVMADGAQFKLVQLQKFHMLRYTVNLAITEEEIGNIEW